MSGERRSADRDGGAIKELPCRIEVQRGTRWTQRFPAGVFHRGLGGKHFEEKCNRQAGQRHNIAVVLELVKALFNSSAGII